jgi:hypothetical protein
MNLTEYIDAKHDEHLNDLYEFLRIPSVSAQTEHKPDIERAAQWVSERLRGAGMDKVEILPTKMHPLVYGESLRAPGKPTILFSICGPRRRLSQPCAAETCSAAAPPTTRGRFTSTSAPWMRS